MKYLSVRAVLYLSTLLNVFFISPVFAGNEFIERMRSYTDSCWFCGIFRALFNALNNMISVTAESSKGTFLVLLALGFLFWILFRVGRVVLDINPDSGDKTFIPDFFKQMLRVIVASLLIFNYLSVFDSIVSPLLEMSIGLGKKIVSEEQGTMLTTAVQNFHSMERSVGGGHRSSLFPSASKVTESVLCKEYAALEAKSRAVSSLASERSSLGENGLYMTKTSAYSNLVREAFVCFIYSGEVSMSVGMLLGATAIHGGFKGIFDDGGFSLLCIGIILYISFFLLFLSFPLKLFDPLLQLALVSALLPLWCAMWAFETSSKMAKNIREKAWGMFLNVMVTFVVLSLVSVICIRVMNGALPENRTRLYRELIRDKSALSAFKDAGMEVGSKSIVLTLALGIVAFSLMGKVKELAKTFSGAEGMDTGVGALANKATSAAAGLANTGAKMGGHALLGAGGYVAGKTGEKVWNAMTTLTPDRTQGQGVRESIRASKFGRFFGAEWDSKHDSTLRGTLRADGKTEVITSKNDDRSTDRYNARTGELQQYDKKGALRGSFNIATNELNLGGGRKYNITGRTITQGNRKIDLATDTYTFTAGEKQYVQSASGNVLERRLNSTTGRYELAREYRKNATTGVMEAFDWDAAAGRFNASTAPLPADLNQIVSDAANFKHGAEEAERIATPMRTRGIALRTKYDDFKRRGHL